MITKICENVRSCQDRKVSDASSGSFAFELDITNKDIRTFANPAVGLDIARFSLKVELGFWGHLDGKHMHNAKLGVVYTF